MIPSYNTSGVLPPYLLNPTDIKGISPYKTNLVELIQHFATSEHRIMLLDNYLNYRKDLKNSGCINGFQWIDGSFLEDCEKLRNRQPNDIDLVTFSYRPEQYSKDHLWKEFWEQNPELFNPQIVKSKYNCDAYFIDLNLDPFFLIRRSSYWFGLFSHQRETALWKGMLEIELSEDEVLAEKLLLQGVLNDT